MGFIRYKLFQKNYNICFDNDLVPQEMKSEFTSLDSLLRSGIPINKIKNLKREL